MLLVKKVGNWGLPEVKIEIDLREVGTVRSEDV
jgi:hypothetical protein